MKPGHSPHPVARQTRDPQILGAGLSPRVRPHLLCAGWGALGPSLTTRLQIRRSSSLRPRIARPATRPRRCSCGHRMQVCGGSFWVGAAWLLDAVAVGQTLAGRWSMSSPAVGSPAVAVRTRSGRLGGDPVVVESEEVVSGVDQPPFRAHGRTPAAVEPVDLAVELRVGEHRLDHSLASAVEALAVFTGEHAAHELIHTAGPPGSDTVAFVRVGWDQHRDPARRDPLHLLGVPVPGVSQHYLGSVSNPGAGQFGLGGEEYRFEVSEVRIVDADLRGDHHVLLVDCGLRVVALHEPAGRRACCVSPDRSG
jgi:hypothetical protein